MGETIIDGAGSAYSTRVDEFGRLYVVGSIVSMPSISVSTTTGSEQYIKAGSVIVTNNVSVIGSVVVTSPINVTTGSESYIKGGSIQTYSPLGVGSVRVAEWGINTPVTFTGSFSSYGVGSVRISEQGVNPWITLGSTQITNSLPLAVTGSVSSYGTGSIRLSELGINPLPVSGLYRSIPTVVNGSVLVPTAGIGSTILPSLLNTINWVSIRVSGNAPGSVYTFGIKDSEGFLIQSQNQHTGDWAFLSPITASGVLVYTISGTNASGTYHFRTAYF